MKRVVHKYEIPYGESYCGMPADAEIVAVGAIAGKMYAWAIVDPDAANTARPIGYFATGELIPESAKYVGTALAGGGAFVWHVFEYALSNTKAGGER